MTMVSLEFLAYKIYEMLIYFPDCFRVNVTRKDYVMRFTTRYLKKKLHMMGVDVKEVKEAKIGYALKLLEDFGLIRILEKKHYYCHGTTTRYHVQVLWNSKAVEQLEHLAKVTSR